VNGFYLGQSDFTGRYGPAGAVVALIVWIYYSAQILFIGAVFTREYAASAKPGPVPAAAGATPGTRREEDGTPGAH
jgi:membrane protein